MAGPPVMVHACTRDGRGGSPTAVVIDDATLTDDDRQAVARRAGTSHTAFIAASTADTPAVRFFTSAGELRNCGHGIIAAQAVLLHRSGATEHHGRQSTGGRTFATTAIRRHDGIEVWFDQGVIALADHTGGAVITALGLRPADLAVDVRVASPGTPRLLVAVRDHPTLLSMRPDFDRLATECRRLGYLGCFVYALSPTARTATARMFAPTIGVDEDIANANSVGCLAAHLLDTSGNGEIEVHQGDTFRRPSSVFAGATHTESGIAARIGGMVALPRPPGIEAGPTAQAPAPERSPSALLSTYFSSVRSK